MSLPTPSHSAENQKNWPFQIKICGITQMADAIMAEAAGADALGFNFYPRSMRCTNAHQVAEIKSQLSNRMHCVGVFVNHDVRAMIQLADNLGLSAIQLHGDETPQIMTALTGYRVIRCIRPPRETTAAAWLVHCRTWIDAGVQAILIDAPPPVRRADNDALPNDGYGGTGNTVDWKLAAELADELAVPLILAGGLNPDNISAAIAAVNPRGVDVASGVESFPGKKNSAQLESFVAQAQRAFARQTVEPEG